MIKKTIRYAAQRSNHKWVSSSARKKKKKKELYKAMMPAAPKRPAPLPRFFAGAGRSVLASSMAERTSVAFCSVAFETSVPIEVSPGLLVSTSDSGMELTFGPKLSVPSVSSPSLLTVENLPQQGAQCRFINL